MARSPHAEQAFLREVDEEVRRDQMSAAVRRYGIIAAVAVVVVLLAFGGWLFWQHHRETQAGERGEQFTAAMSALTAGNTAKAKTALDQLAASEDKGYAPLARVLIADMAVRDNKTADAAATFAKIAADTAVPQPIRDLALVRGTALAFDTLPPQQVIDRMKPLTGAGKPWAGSAGEMTGLAQLKLGQTKQAGATLAALARDTTVPRSLRERASQLAGDLGVDVTLAEDAAAS